MKGLYTALITPFDENLDIDYESLKKLIEFQIENKVDGIVIFGTTGESPTIDEEEFFNVLEFIKQYKNDIEFIIGTGTNNTNKTIEKTKKVLDMGFDKVLIVTPYYNKPNVNGLYEHYKNIALTSAKIILYEVPSRVSISIPIEVIKKLKQEFSENIIALKFSNSDLDLLSRIILEVKNLDILSGDDNLTLPMMSLGAVGVVSVLSNVFPGEIRELVYSALDGDFNKAREIHYKMYKLFKLAFIETNPIPIKYIAYKKNLIKTPYVRLPLSELSEKNKEIIDQNIL
ncbi:MAG: 4-hydroxy-tetrahydrodipicolinate synthase [candidate division WOR-3 bacterium]